MPGVEIRAVDETGKEIAWDGKTMGELQIRGPWIASSYYNDERSAQSFMDGWFRTGDLARRRTDGFVELVGRSKEIISRGGNKIAPLEIDQLFAAHPDVAAALTTGIPDPLLGESLHTLGQLRGLLDHAVRPHAEHPPHDLVQAVFAPLQCDRCGLPVYPIVWGDESPGAARDNCLRRLLWLRPQYFG